MHYTAKLNNVLSPAEPLSRRERNLVEMAVMLATKLGLPNAQFNTIVEETGRGVPPYSRKPTPKAKSNADKEVALYGHINSSVRALTQFIQMVRRDRRAEILKKIIQEILRFASKGLQATHPGVGKKGWKVRSPYRFEDIAIDCVNLLFEDMAAEKKKAEEAIKRIAQAVTALQLPPQDQGVLLKRIIWALLHQNKAKFAWSTPEWQAKNLKPTIERYAKEALDKQKPYVLLNTGKMKPELGNQVIGLYQDAFRKLGYETAVRPTGNQTRVVIVKKSRQASGSPLAGSRTAADYAEKHGTPKAPPEKPLLGRKTKTPWPGAPKNRMA